MKNNKLSSLICSLLLMLFMSTFAQEKREGYFNNIKLGVISVLSKEYGGIHKFLYSYETS